MALAVPQAVSNQSGFRWDETAGLVERYSVHSALKRCNRRPAMKKNSKQTASVETVKKNSQGTTNVETTQANRWEEKPKVTVGLDLGDRYSYYCMLNEEGEVFEEGRIQT